MYKRLSLILILVGIIFTLQTQKSNAQMQLGLDLGPNIPVGDFGDVAETGLGFKIVFKYFFNDNVAFMANIGYSSFEWEENYWFGRGWGRGDDFRFNIVPINLNVEYHFGGNPLKPYLSGGLGIYALSINNDNDNWDDDDRYQSTEVGLNLGGGLAYEIGNNLDLTADLKFHLVENASFVGLNFGILYGF